MLNDQTPLQMFRLLLLLAWFLHTEHPCTDTWFRFLFVLWCQLADFLWEHHPSLSFLCRCCASDEHYSVDGGTRGRPPGTKNRTAGKPQRTSKRRHTRKFKYGDQAGPSAKRAAKQRKATQRKRNTQSSKSSGPVKRTLTAASRKRGKHTKDARRARAIDAKRKERREFADELQQQLSSLAVPSLTIGQLKPLALSAFYRALAKAWPTRQSAAEFAAGIFQVHPKTLLTWASELEFALLSDGPSDLTGAGELAEQLLNCKSLWQSLRGRHAKTVWLLADNQKQQEARVWVLSHADRPGKPTMKVSHFKRFLNRKLLRLGPDNGISDSTARAYLHRLGFVVLDTQSGIVIELHERDDVVQSRAEFVMRVQSELAQGAVLVYQDESCFSSNDCPRWVWGQKGSKAAKTKAKNRGKAIMVSLFATCEAGIVSECTLLLDIGTDGYFNTKRFLTQVCAHVLVCWSSVPSCVAFRVHCRWSR